MHQSEVAFDGTPLAQDLEPSRLEIDGKADARTSRARERERKVAGACADVGNVHARVQTQPRFDALGQQPVATSRVIEPLGVCWIEGSFAG